MLGQVRQELRHHTAGVTGVPHFVINGRYHLSGAQETSTFVEVPVSALSMERRDACAEL